MNGSRRSSPRKAISSSASSPSRKRTNVSSTSGGASRTWKPGCAQGMCQTSSPTWTNVTNLNAGTFLTSVWQMRTSGSVASSFAATSRRSTRTSVLFRPAASAIDNSCMCSYPSVPVPQNSAALGPIPPDGRLKADLRNPFPTRNGTKHTLFSPSPSRAEFNYFHPGLASGRSTRSARSARRGILRLASARFHATRRVMYPHRLGADPSRAIHLLRCFHSTLFQVPHDTVPK